MRACCRVADGNIVGYSPRALIVGRNMEALRFGVKPADLPTLPAAVDLVVLTTLIGSVMPTPRALRVDPITALRAE